jgi:hypothetical protein
VLYRYGKDAGGALGELPVCAGPLGDGRAALRFAAAVHAFAETGAVYDACQSDLSAPMQSIGQTVYNQLSRLCVPGPLVDGDPATAGTQPTCAATLLEPAPGAFHRRAIPTCQTAGSETCLQLAPDPSCADSGVAMRVLAGDHPPAPGTEVAVSCLAPGAPGPAGPPPPACTGATTCPPRKALGQSCALDASMSIQIAAYRTDAPECASGLCLRPATEPGVASFPHTGPTCSRSCQVDADCADAEVRDGTPPDDTRCKSGYTCAVPFEVGPLCCRKICVCRDFVPSGGAPTPAGCDPALPASLATCPNR